MSNWDSISEFLFGWFWDLPEKRRHQIILGIDTLVLVTCLFIYQADKALYLEAVEDCTLDINLLEDSLREGLPPLNLTIGRTEDTKHNGLNEIENIDKQNEPH